MEQRWAVPEDVLAARLQDEIVLLHLGTKDYYRLNETAAVAWLGFERGCTATEIVDQLCAAFTIDREAAAAALHTLTADLLQRALIASAAPVPQGNAS